MLRCTARHFRAATLALVGAVTVALAVMTACDVPATNVPAGSLGVPSATARVAAAASPIAPAAALSDQSHGFLTLETECPPRRGEQCQSRDSPGRTLGGRVS